MMPKGKEFWSRDFAARYGHSRLVADEDKYLFATEAPMFRFNAIGAGTMGQKHIRVTNFEAGQASTASMIRRLSASKMPGQLTHGIARNP